MNSTYYIAYNPLTYSLMDLHGKINDVMDILSYLTELDSSKLSASNYLDFLSFDADKERKGMVETLAIESYTLSYIANQIARVDRTCRVVLSDGKRKTLREIITREKCRPRAVFMTSMSSNFPAAAATIILLNHAQIPVIIGGIHVSTSPEDLNIYVKKHLPYPDLVSQVFGPGDSKVFKTVLGDISSGNLKSEYFGSTTIEDGVWGSHNIQYMNPMRMELLSKIPFIGSFLVNKVKVNGISPYLGCPYSCNFCSISSLPTGQRKFTSRSAEDFVNELQYYQKDGINSQNRFFFFLPDNLMLGGKLLDEILDRIIESNLRINYAAQVSIDVANDEELLSKLRLSGATHFFIGFESLDIRNLEFIGKHIVKDIKRSHLPVTEYYARQIRRIQNHGISIHASFIFGLPFDRFEALDDHTGLDIESFCTANHIGLQPCSLTDLPGSINFKHSQESGTYLTGKHGSIDYLAGLCTSDLTEINRVPPKSLYSSPLITFYIAYHAIQKAGRNRRALMNALYMMIQAFLNPTKNGLASFGERMVDSLWAFASQIAVSQYKDHAELIAYSKNNVRGAFIRLYDQEEDHVVRELLHNYVRPFA